MLRHLVVTLVMVAMAGLIFLVGHLVATGSAEYLSNQYELLSYLSGYTENVVHMDHIQPLADSMKANYGPVMNEERLSVILEFRKIMGTSWSYNTFLFYLMVNNRDDFIKAYNREMSAQDLEAWKQKPHDRKAFRPLSPFGLSVLSLAGLGVLWPFINRFSPIRIRPAQ